MSKYHQRRGFSFYSCLAITSGIIAFIWLPHRQDLAITSLILMVIGLIITIGSNIKISSENNNQVRNRYYQ